MRLRPVAIALAGLLAATGLTATPASAESTTLFNTTPITFSGSSPSGGSAYPSTIQVGGVEGSVTDIDVHINAITMGDISRLTLLVVS